MQWFNSFKHAMHGIILFFRTERNAKIELVAAGMAITLSVWLRIPTTEFCIILLCIGGVLSAEAFNSAIEQLADEQSLEINPRIKALKDMAAGAVLMISIISMIIGVLILGTELLAIIGSK